MTINLINTAQQDDATAPYFLHCQQAIERGFVAFPFWEFYARWCEENGLYNDRGSYQYDEGE